MFAETSFEKLARSVPSSRLRSVPSSSSRLSMGPGVEDRVKDIVTIFPQTELTEPENLTFRRFEPKIGKRVYTTKGRAVMSDGMTREVNFVGREEKAGDGFEYVLVEVNSAGRAEKIRRTALINFQPCLSSQIASSKDEKEKQNKAADYSANFASTSEKYHAERKRLTADFGSVKKNKQLDAYMRRSVTNETLEAMTSTAFSSTNIISKNDGEEDEDGKEDKKLSILGQTSSSVLPMANLQARSPADVYTLDQFMPAEGDELSKELQQEALTFFRQHANIQQIVNLGIAPFVAKRVGNPLRFGNPGRRCCLSLKAIALAKLVQLINKVKGFGIRNFSIKELEELSSSVPPIMLQHIRSMYLGSAQVASKKVFLELSDEQRNRILAELLCLLLLFDDPDYIVPISPLVQELGVAEHMIKNLLTAMGCLVTVANEAQALSLNTIRVARLIGPPNQKNGNVLAGAGRKRVRQLTRKST